MTPKKFISTMLTRSCIYFTVVMLIYIIIAAIINVADGRLLLDAGRTILFYVFSALLALANCLWSLKKLGTAPKLLLHYIIALFAFYTCFLLPTAMRASAVIIGIIIFTIVYFAIIGIVAAFRSKFRSNLEKTQTYQKQYRK